VVYGARQAYRDFDSLPLLLEALRLAGVDVSPSAIADPDPQASSILVSQSVEVDYSAILRLALDE